MESTPRMKIYLERPKSEGGLGLPNFLHYNWAANISKLTYWVFSDIDGPVWATMELTSHTSTSQTSLLSAPSTACTNTKIFSNLVVFNSIKINYNTKYNTIQFRKHFNFNQMNGFSPLLLNHHTLTNRLKFCWLAPTQINLILDNSIMSSEFLRKEHDLPIFQISSSSQLCFQKFLYLPQTSK